MSRVWSDKETWPEVRVTLLPLLWTWRLRPRVHAHPGYASFAWLCLRVEAVAQDSWRDWFREDEDDGYFYEEDWLSRHRVSMTFSPGPRVLP